VVAAGYVIHSLLTGALGAQGPRRTTAPVLEDDGSVFAAQFQPGGKGKFKGGKGRRGGADWLPSYEGGLARARQTGQPIFVTIRCEP
jgi:hypothetical protein